VHQQDWCAAPGRISLSTTDPDPGSGVKLLIDFLPLLAFFGTYKIGRYFPDAGAALFAAILGPLDAPAALAHELTAVLLATMVAILASAVQLGWLALGRHPIRPSVWLSVVLILVFGGLTLWLRDEWFIKAKPTILDATFAVLLLGGRWLFGRNLLGMLLGEEIELPPAAWDRLLYAWSAFFVLMALANVYVAAHFSTDSWVDFKTFGSIGLTFVFSLATGVYVMRHMKPQGDA